MPNCENHVWFDLLQQRKLLSTTDSVGEEHSQYTNIMTSEFLELFNQKGKIRQASITRNNSRLRSTIGSVN